MTQPDLDTVAEAIWRAQNSLPPQNDYQWSVSRRMAAAAVEALQLTEERTTHYPRSPIEIDADYVRLVGPYYPVEQP